MTRAAALQRRCHLVRVALQEHWRISDRLGAHLPTLRESAAAMALLGSPVDKEVAELVAQSNWASTRRRRWPALPWEHPLASGWASWRPSALTSSRLYLLMLAVAVCQMLLEMIGRVYLVWLLSVVSAAVCTFVLAMISRVHLVWRGRAARLCSPRK